MKALIVLTSHDRLGDTGRKTGFWLEELAAPYYVFRDAGLEIALASPKGGRPPMDPGSAEADAQTEATKRFLVDTTKCIFCKSVKNIRLLRKKEGVARPWPSDAQLITLRVFRS